MWYFLCKHVLKGLYVRQQNWRHNMLNTIRYMQWSLPRRIHHSVEAFQLQQRKKRLRRKKGWHQTGRSHIYR